MVTTLPAELVQAIVQELVSPNPKGPVGEALWRYVHSVENAAYVRGLQQCLDIATKHASANFVAVRQNPEMQAKYDGEVAAARKIGASIQDAITQQRMKEALVTNG